MGGINNKVYGVGLLLLIIGAVGLAGINPQNDVCFWVCSVLFSVGFGCCLVGYFK